MVDEPLAVVIAAGVGSRLLPITSELPKCMLEVQGQTMLRRALGTFLDLGITRSVVVGGYKSENLQLPDRCNLVLNHQYRSNNILHSLAYARESMHGAGSTLVSYSDIIFRKQVVERLLNTNNADIAIVVDQAWPARYESRLLHPLPEAEAAQFDEVQQLRTIGKGLLSAGNDTRCWGEFIGMMKLTQRGQELFWGVFDDVNSNLGPEDPFQRASVWRLAYVTDLLQELVDRGVDVHCTLIQGGWLEIDTTEDYETAAVFDFSDGCA